MRKDLGNKAVVLGTVLVFIFSAFTSAVGLNVRINVSQSIEKTENEDIDTETEEPVEEAVTENPIGSESGLSKTSDNSLRSKSIQMRFRSNNIVSNTPFIRLYEQFISKGVNNDADDINHEEKQNKVFSEI